MLLMLVSLVLILLGIAMMKFTSFDSDDIIFFLGLILVLFGVIMLFCLVGSIIGVQFSAEVDYQNTIAAKEMLEYRIHQMEENIVGNELLFNDIVEFNNELRKVKTYCNSLWTNWFYNQKIATIDYIVLPQ